MQCLMEYGCLPENFNNKDMKFLKNNLLLLIVLISSFALFTGCKPLLRIGVSSSVNDLTFPALAQSWDEGIPLGNATVGALVWQK